MTTVQVCLPKQNTLLLPWIYNQLGMYIFLLLSPEEDELSKALMCYCFPDKFGEHIFLDLFHFVNLASSCSLIPLQLVVFSIWALVI